MEFKFNKFEAVPVSDGAPQRGSLALKKLFSNTGIWSKLAPPGQILTPVYQYLLYCEGKEKQELKFNKTLRSKTFCQSRVLKAQVPDWKSF